MSTSVPVLGEEVALPVEVRVARSAMASFLAPIDGVRRLLDGTGVEPAPLPGGRSLCIIAVVQYLDNDLGPYHEVAVAFPVAARGGAPAGAYIHQLPVNQPFTLAAGREVWGFPKWMAEIDLHFGRDGVRCRLAEDGEEVLTLTIGRRPVPLPSRRPAEMSAYANIDGTLRCTPFTSDASQVRGGPAGARLQLGDRHPVARELAGLDLSRRAAMSTTIGNMAARFGPAVEVPST